MSLCPCGTGLEYEACCAPFHERRGESPSPEQLMRSRFAAFALGLHEYLWDTLHRDHDDRSRDRAVFLADMRKGASSWKYRKLDILETRDPDAEGIALVLFAVTMSQRGRDVSFVELSRFAREADGWRYLFGTVRPRSRCPKDLGALTIDSFDRQ